jgi:hypothetical protein
MFIKKSPTLVLSCLVLLLGTVLYNRMRSENSLEGEELQRVTSPDKVVDAVLVELSANAVTSTKYAVYIVARGSQPENGAEILMADHVKGLHLSWAQSQLLRIKYDESRIYYFTNFWQAEAVKNFNYVVEAQLSPQTQPFSLRKEDR